jgi:hypothetical protein
MYFSFSNGDSLSDLLPVIEREFFPHNSGIYTNTYQNNEIRIKIHRALSSYHIFIFGVSENGVSENGYQNTIKYFQHRMTLMVRMVMCLFLSQYGVIWACRSLLLLTGSREHHFSIKMHTVRCHHIIFLVLE